MVEIKEAILVEGRYDKAKVSQVVDTLILTTNGFGVFNDKKLQNLIKNTAEHRGLIVLTDSDSAGFVIRNFIKSIVDPDKLRHAYIPPVEGKEKRKAHISKEGKLGVEGMPLQVLMDSIMKAGTELSSEMKKTPMTKTDLYELGLTGKPYSGQLRKKLLTYLQLPEYISTNALINFLNSFMTVEELAELLHELESI